MQPIEDYYLVQIYYFQNFVKKSQNKGDVIFGWPLDSWCGQNNQIPRCNLRLLTQGTED